MTRKAVLVSDPYKCPIRNVAHRFSDKWSILVILAMGAKRDTMRFNELRHSIGEISQKMLTVTLRTLEADGIVLRIQYSEIPMRVEYSLTELGSSLSPLLADINAWSIKHQETIFKSRKKFLARNSSQ